MLAWNTVGAGQPRIHAPGLQESCRNKAWSLAWLQAWWFPRGSRAARGGGGGNACFPAPWLTSTSFLSLYSLIRRIIGLVRLSGFSCAVVPSLAVSRLRPPSALDQRWPRDSWSQTGNGLIKNDGGVLGKGLADLRCDISSVYVTCSFYLWVPDQISTDASEICSH